jgi:outer membrane protein assembly factor BamE (lipoprotein component of BamABCDE complex)
MKNLFKLLLAIMVVSVLVACGNKLTPDNFTQVKNGMTEMEVKDLLGKPSSVKSEEMLGLSTTNYIYTKGESEVKIGFIYGKVTYKSGNFK